MLERVRTAPELFLVAVEKHTGEIAGFLNGLSTDEEKFRDEFFTDAGLCSCPANASTTSAVSSSGLPDGDVSKGLPPGRPFLFAILR